MEPRTSDQQPDAAPAVDGSLIPPVPLDREVATRQARAAVLDFSRTSWSNASAPGGKAVAALANLLESSPCKSAPLDSYTSEMRVQASRLLHADAGSPAVGQGGWIKGALIAAVAALDAARPTSASTSGWIGAARDAVEAIDDHATLAFARAPIQGAMRATMDATILVLQSVCPS